MTIFLQKKIKGENEMITHDEATDKNIITKQVVINTPTSAHLLPITADEKVIDEIQQALDELERLKKQEKLLELYKELQQMNEYLIIAFQMPALSSAMDNFNEMGGGVRKQELLKQIKEIKAIEND